MRRAILIFSLCRGKLGNTLKKNLCSGVIDDWSKNGTLMSQSLGEGDLCRLGCSQAGTEWGTCILVFIERNIDQGTKQRLQIHTVHSFSFSFPLSDLSFIVVQILWKFTRENFCASVQVTKVQREEVGPSFSIIHQVFGWDLSTLFLKFFYKLQFLFLWHHIFFPIWLKTWLLFFSLIIVTFT